MPPELELLTFSPPPHEFLSSRIEMLGYSLKQVYETTSTMDEAQKFSPGVVVTADHQIRGRGRVGRSWLDEPGKSLLATVVEPFDPEIEALPIHASQLFVLSALRAINRVGGADKIKIRWPSDLVFDNKKLGGILIENHTDDSGSKLFFGLGVNFDYENADGVFPATDYGATSVQEAFGRGLLREEVLVEFLRFWKDAKSELVQIDSPEIFDYYQALWRANSELLGKTIEIKGIGKNFEEKVLGKVCDTPFGGGIVMDIEGSLQEISEYHSQTIVQPV